MARSLVACSSSCWRRVTSPSSSWGAHWKGVCALGTKTATEMDTETPLLGPSISRPICTTRSAVCGMPRMSSSVSVGRPIMK